MLTFSQFGERQTTKMSVLSCISLQKGKKDIRVFVLKQYCQMATYTPLKKEGKTVYELKTRQL